MAEQAKLVHEVADEFIRERRRFLIQALSTGALVGGAGWNFTALAGLLGKVPGKMPDGKSVFDLKGDVRIDGEPATRDTLVTAQSRIETGPDSLIIVAVGDGAFIVRERSVVEMSGKQLLIRGLQLISGGLLSVFGHRDDDQRVQVVTPTAVIAIRGTGFYAENEMEGTYFCTCYGHTRIDTVGGGEGEDIVSRHHDAPRMILAQATADSGKRIVKAPFRNHTDLELMTLESLRGRQVPFGIPSDTYDAPRRDY